MASENKISRQVARFFTFLFDVPLVAIFSFSLFYFLKHTDTLAYLVSVIFIGIIPLFAWAYLLFHKGDYKGERKVSFLIDAVSYPIGFLILLLRNIHSFYTALVLSYLLNVIFLIVINKLLKYKASGHAAGVAGPGTALTIVFGWWGAISFLLLMPVFYAKITLREHTFMQLTVGALLSTVLTYLSFVIIGVI